MKRALYGESVPPTGNDCGLDDSERSSSALGAFRIGSLRKLCTVSVAVPDSLETMQHSRPSMSMDPSLSSSFDHCQEDRLKTDEVQ
jgi:hypothetical protein